MGPPRLDTPQSRRARCRTPGLGRLATLILLVQVGSCGAPRSDIEPEPRSEASRNDWLVVPGVRVGPVDSTTSEHELIDRLGVHQIDRREIQIGEGMCSPGSVIYPGTPDSVEILWTDTTFTRPAAATVWRAGSRWRTPAGVHVGSTLVELDSLNSGRPVRFTGFGWNYGGTGSWSESGGAIGIVLHPDRALMDLASRDSRYKETLGEREIGSDHPLFRTLNVHVERMFIRWSEPSVQFDCHGLGTP